MTSSTTSFADVVNFARHLGLDTPCIGSFVGIDPDEVTAVPPAPAGTTPHLTERLCAAAKIFERADSVYAEAICSGLRVYMDDALPKDESLLALLALIDSNVDSADDVFVKARANLAGAMSEAGVDVGCVQVA